MGHNVCLVYSVLNVDVLRFCILSALIIRALYAYNGIVENIFTPISLKKYAMIQPVHPQVAEVI